MVINKIIYFKIYLPFSCFFRHLYHFHKIINTEKFLKPHCYNETNFQKINYREIRNYG